MGSEADLKKQQWDVGTWRFGLIAGSILGLTFALCFEANRQVRLIHLRESLRLEIIGYTGLCIGVVLPAILAGIARRRWLLWAYLPYALLLTWLEILIFVGRLTHVTGSAVGVHSTGPSPLSRWVLCLCAPFSAALPICIVRWQRAASRARMQENLLIEQAQFTIERTGVWPPPITTPADSPDADVPGHNYR